MTDANSPLNQLVNLVVSINQKKHRMFTIVDQILLKREPEFFRHSKRQSVMEFVLSMFAMNSLFLVVVCIMLIAWYSNELLFLYCMLLSSVGMLPIPS